MQPEGFVLLVLAGRQQLTHTERRAADLWLSCGLIS